MERVSRASRSWILALLAIAAVAFVAVPSVREARRRADTRWTDVLAIWEEARPALERRVRERALREFESRLDPAGPWSRTWVAERSTLEATFTGRHLQGIVPPLSVDVRHGLWHDDYRAAARLVVDLPLESVADRDVPLAEALASVRFVDVRCEVSLVREGQRLLAHATVGGAGAWLDDEVAAWVAEVLAAAGFPPDPAPHAPEPPE